MIPIKNIFYMLSYAFTDLKKRDIQKISSEKFENIYDLFSEIYIIGINRLLKMGLGKEYISNIEELSGVRGRIDINQSITRGSILSKKLVCEFDEFHQNSKYNQILKTTMLALLKCDIGKSRKKTIHVLLTYFKDVSNIDLKNIRWDFRFTRNDRVYNLLIYISELIYKESIFSSDNEGKNVNKFEDSSSMHSLYERFILEYYKREYPKFKVGAPYINWKLGSSNNNLLPVMKSDVVIRKNDEEIIIDAKYYNKNLQENYNKKSIHSANLYQIFTYVKNRKTDANVMVSGVLLYPKTSSGIEIDEEYVIDGNRILVKTLDLSGDFDVIRNSLNLIVEK